MMSARKTSLALAISVLLVVCGLTASSVQAAPYAFVSSLGDDLVLRLDVELGRAGWQGPAMAVTDAWDIAYGPDGNLYVSSLSGNVIKKYDFATSTLSDYASIVAPMDLTFFNGSMYAITDENDQDRVLRRKPDGTMETYISFAGMRDFGFGSDRNGDGIADLYGAGGEVRVFTSQGDAGTRFDSGTPDGSYAYALTWGPDMIGGDRIGDLFVGDLTRDCVSLYNGATGAYVRDFVTTGSGGLGQPMDLAFGPDGKLYVVDMAGTPSWGAVRIYDGSTGAFVKSIEGLSAPTGIAFDPPVPEPSALMVLAGGLGAFGFAIRRKR